MSSSSPSDSKFPQPFRIGHKQFVLSNYARPDSLLPTLAKTGQTPRVLWVGCVDSRVSPERIVGADHGDIMVVRNVANIVPPVDAEDYSVGSALSFALEVCGVRQIVVCGHSDCGGIKTLAKLGKSSRCEMLESWMHFAATALEDAGADDLVALEKANTVLQATRFLDYPGVTEAIDKDELTIHACYYEIESGSLYRYEAATKAWIDVDTE